MHRIATEEVLDLAGAKYLGPTQILHDPPAENRGIITLVPCWRREETILGNGLILLSNYYQICFYLTLVS